MHNVQMTARLSHINLFPVKSCAPLTPAEGHVEWRGLRGDRRWMIVDAEGRFLTARKHPRLVLINAQVEGANLRLNAPRMPELELQPAPSGAGLKVRVWRDDVLGRAATDSADAWICRYLGFPARLVYMDEQTERAVDANYARPGDIVSFADGFPLLLISQASLDLLNSKLASPLPMLRFRPNLVVNGTDAHAEDGWRSIRIGNIPFDVVKPCIRCVLTTVDPASGQFDAAGEPLRTLLGYRRTPNGIAFGQNLIPRGTGTLALGDAVEVIA